MTITIKSEKEMLKKGQEFGKTLVPHTIIALRGTLGAGKTVFVKGIAKALKIDEPILSPTFTLVQKYDGTIPLYHLDLYRLGSIEEFELIDGRSIISSSSIICIEWPEIISDYLKNEHIIDINISINKDNSRTVKIV